MKSDDKFLRNIFNQEIVQTSPEKIRYASGDQSFDVEKKLPLAVLKPRNKKELYEAARTCLKNNLAIVPRGAGTGKTGGATPSKNSVVIDCTLLNKINFIDEKKFIASVEPGVILKTFQEQAEQKNLFYPPDPASRAICSMGGNIAENASGPSTLKYGCTRDYFLGGEGIIGTGEIISFGKNGPKGVAGYDLASLICGSEGTLCLLSEIKLRLLPKPKDVAAALFYFDCDEQALSAAQFILREGFLPRALEFIDQTCLKALKFFDPKNSWPHDGALLLVECDANLSLQAGQTLQAIASFLQSHGLRNVVMAQNDRERKNFWESRAKLSEATKKYGGQKISEDVALPLSELNNYCKLVQETAKKFSLTVAFFGHVGDGNLHTQILFGQENKRALARMLKEKILHIVLELGGTIAAEHGIGLQKKSFLPLEQSALLIELQKQIKRVFDPKNLLNPDKIF